MPEEPRWSPLVHAVFDGALMATGRCHAIPTGYAGGVVVEVAAGLS